MKLEHPVQFDVYRLDPLSARLSRGDQAIPLTPKAFALLSHLTQRAGQLVTKQQLFQTVWADALVSDAAVTVCIREIRKALRDNARKPRFIETVHRRGYRFIAPVVPLEPGLPDASGVSALSSARSPTTIQLGSTRDRRAQLAKLRRGLVKTQQGDHEVVFVTGEMGSAETTLVHALVHQAAQSGYWIGGDERQQDMAEPALPRG